MIYMISDNGEWNSTNFKLIWYLRYGFGPFLSASTMAYIIPMGSLSKGLNCGLTLNWTGPQLMSVRFEGLSFYYLLGAFLESDLSLMHLVSRLLQNRSKVNYFEFYSGGNITDIRHWPRWIFILWIRSLNDQRSQARYLIGWEHHLASLKTSLKTILRYRSWGEPLYYA